MLNERIDNLAREIEREADEALAPMPYHDVGSLLRNVTDPDAFEELPADLSHYWLQGIQGPCSRVRADANRSLQAEPEESLMELEQYLQLSFFETFPRYAELAPLVTPEDTPALHQRMTLQDQLRLKLLRFVRLVLAK